MKRLLISTTALSVALMQINPAALMAQTVTEDGSIIADDGSVLCLGTQDQPCDLNAVMDQLKAQEAAAAEAAAQAEAEAAAQAAADAAAQAEADAAAQAEADAAAQAEAQRQADEAAAADAQRQADEAAAADAQRQADEAAAADAQRQADEAAAADAQRQADEAAAADAQRQADEAAAADAQRQADEAAAADAQRQADEAAAAEEAQRQADEAAAADAQRQADEAAAADAQRQADEAAAADAQRQADEAAAADAQRQADEAAADAATDPAADAATDPAADVATDPAADVATDPAADVATDPAADAATDPAADAATDPAADVATDPAADVATDPAADAVTDPAADAVTDPAAVVEPVDPPAPTEQAVEQLTTLMSAPEAVEPAALEAAANLVPIETVEGEPTVIPESQDAEAVVVQQITEATARSSSEEFAAAPTAVASGSGKKRSGMTDLEKVGLVALGALVVGAIINNSRANTQDEVVSNSGDRVVVRRGSGDYVVYKDDDALLRRPGSTVRTETFRDGSTRTIVERGDGTQVVTIRDVTGRVLRRATYDGLGREVILIDDLAPEEVIDVTTLPKPRARVISMSTSEEDALLKARMAALDAQEIGRSFSLRQIRDIREVRNLAATVDVNNITFDTGSSAINPTQAESLASLGRFLAQMVKDNPNEVFLIEGHTDAVGSAASNLALSDRRAESVALALTEYFDVPPENMVVQGYGESDLRVQSEGDERQNRRVAVRIVTPLLSQASASLQ
ncbi:hypothetical protein HYN69_09610 [Gemmobacter aquarius]|uniref:OmpA-like domain-containing protein n=1 Tax=Paragemmobacter aquarius TaxID=2169400 RepID=A0A2S0ULN4_9RHOB|nr:OmpA family protein [Gemmobacter aquarius]AWB48734.1 hypothetical protein HYN69_09610 [Gemmobacter aquarius]